MKFVWRLTRFCLKMFLVCLGFSKIWPSDWIDNGGKNVSTTGQQPSQTAGAAWVLWWIWYELLVPILWWVESLLLTATGREDNCVKGATSGIFAACQKLTGIGGEVCGVRNAWCRGRSQGRARGCDWMGGGTWMWVWQGSCRTKWNSIHLQSSGKAKKNRARQFTCTVVAARVGRSATRPSCCIRQGNWKALVWNGASLDSSGAIWGDPTHRGTSSGKGSSTLHSWTAQERTR